jgi:hypothetical protein
MRRERQHEHIDGSLRICGIHTTHALSLVAGHVVKNEQAPGLSTVEGLRLQMAKSISGLSLDHRLAQDHRQIDAIGPHGH